MPNEHYYKDGDDVVLSVNTGTNAAPTWVTVQDAEDIMIEATRETFVRKPRGFKANMKGVGRIDGPLKFKYNVPINATDPVYLLLVDSFWAKTPLQFAVTDLPIANGAARGFKGYYVVTNWPQGGGTEGMTIDVVAELTDYVEGGVLIDIAEID